MPVLPVNPPFFSATQGQIFKNRRKEKCVKVTPQLNLMQFPLLIFHHFHYYYYLSLCLPSLISCCFFFSSASSCCFLSSSFISAIFFSSFSFSLAISFSRSMARFRMVLSLRCLVRSKSTLTLAQYALSPSTCSSFMPRSASMAFTKCTYSLN
uniref:Transmembrane protein n=1 Tax=Cacopsylla melanoneura TaxID=428564 RepID=A0A8D8QDU7_9HEMI